MKRSEGLFHDEALRLKFKDRGRKRVGVMPKLWVAIAPLPNLATFGKGLMDQVLPHLAAQ